MARPPQPKRTMCSAIIFGFLSLVESIRPGTQLPKVPIIWACAIAGLIDIALLTLLIILIVVCLPENP